MTGKIWTKHAARMVTKVEILDHENKNENSDLVSIS